MPIMFVNPSGKKRRNRRARRVSGSAKVGKLSFGARMARLRKRRAGKKNPARKARRRSVSVAKKQRRARINPSKGKKMARKKRRSMKRNKSGRFTKARRRGRRTAAKLGHRRRKRRIKHVAAPRRKRRKSRKARKSSSRKRRSRRGRRKSSRKKRRRGRATAARLGHRRRKRRAKGTKTVRMASRTRRGPGGTIVLLSNPSRRRRRKRRSSRRNPSRRRSRRRSRRSYRRNPSLKGIFGDLMNLLKKAIPTVAGYYATKAIVSKVGPMLPVISGLGTLQAPVTSLLVAVGANIATDKVEFLKKRKAEIMLGVGVGVLDAFFSAFAPAALKSAIGVGDVYDRALSEYVGTGEYVDAMGAYLDDNIAMNNYVAVGASEELGVDEALGMAEELGVDEALGASWDYGGLPGGIGGSPSPAMNKMVPARAFSQQVPQRSFARPVPTVSGEFDSPDQLYVGSFAGGFGN